MKLTFIVMICLTLFGMSGCTKSTQTDATPQTEAVSEGEATPRKIIGKTTTKVLPLQTALADGGVLASEQSETGGNPLTSAVGAYRGQAAKIASMQVQQAIQLRNAQSIKRPQPLTHQEFMDEIIQPGQPNGIRLAMLPYYQEYAWDEAAQSLVVVNFPARQETREANR